GWPARRRPRASAALRQDRRPPPAALALAAVAGAGPGRVRGLVPQGAARGRGRPRRAAERAGTHGRRRRHLAPLLQRGARPLQPALAAAGLADLAARPRLRGGAALALAAGRNPAGRPPRPPRDVAAGGRALRAVLRARQPAGLAQPAGHRRPDDRTGRGSPADQLTTKLTRMLTRHSVIEPSSPVTTLISFTQAPLMPLTVLETFFSPDCMASSMPLPEEADTSITLVTVELAMSLLR